MRRGTYLSLAGIAAATVLVAGAALTRDQNSATQDLAHSGTKYVSPAGKGNCAESSPCSLSYAVSRSKAGGIVMLTAGAYGETNLTGKKRSRPLTITSQRGARFTKTLRVKAPDLIWLNLTVDRANVLFSGDRNVVKNLHVRGGSGVGTVFVRGDNVTIRNSLIEGGIAHDGVNIAATSGDFRTRIPTGCGPTRAKKCATVNQGALLERVTVRNIGDVPGTANHSDCIQIYDTAHATIRDSTIYNCDNGAIQTSPGQRHGIWGLTITGNFISRCATPTFPCRAGGAAVDLRANSSVLRSLTFDHNTVATGSVRLPIGNPVRSARYNILSSISVSRPCTTPLSDSLVAKYPRGLDCKHVPGATLKSRSGNVLRPLPKFVDSAHGNLRLVKPLKRVPLDLRGTFTDRDGHKTNTLGADSR